MKNEERKSILINKDIHRRIKELAKRERRTLIGMVEIMLEDAEAKYNKGR